MIGLTRWAACNVSEGRRYEGVNALRVSKIRRHRENVLLLGRGRYLIFLQAWIKHTHTHVDTDMHARTHSRIHPSQEFPSVIPDI